jgi:hypothetical protein
VIGVAALHGLASVTLLSTLDTGQQCANTFHIANGSLGAAPDPATLANLASDLNSYIGTEYKAVLRTVDKLDAIKVAQVPDPTIPGDPYADYLLPLNAAGTRTAVDGLMPREACLCISEKTNSGQRSYRGHMLLPPAGDVAAANGESWKTSQAYYLACAAFAAKLDDGAGTSPTWTGSTLHSWNLAIYSKTLQARALPSVTGVIALVANARIHWLRSRARGTT